MFKRFVEQKNEKPKKPTLGCFFYSVFFSGRGGGWVFMLTLDSRGHVAWGEWDSLAWHEAQSQVRVIRLACTYVNRMTYKLF